MVQVDRGCCIDHCIATPSRGTRSGSEPETRTEKETELERELETETEVETELERDTEAWKAPELRAFEQLAAPLNCVEETPRLLCEDTLGTRCIRKASERALSFDVIDAFDDTLKCLIAARLQQDANHLGPIFGGNRRECGWHQCLDLRDGS